MALIMAQHCVSCDPFFQAFLLSDSTPGKVYTITIQMPWDEREDWTCTCPGFEFRGYCRHIERVHPCRWRELVGPEEQTPEQKAEHICPRCGNNTNKELEDDGSD
jgi:hypothetical protein